MANGRGAGGVTRGAVAQAPKPRAGRRAGDDYLPPEGRQHGPLLRRRRVSGVLPSRVGALAGYFGEDPDPAHPFVEALRDAAPGEVERLVPTQGTMLLTFLGEDAIMRGEMERPGPSVRETSPGVYETVEDLSE